MSAVNNGGPAFPVVKYESPAGMGASLMTIVGGMNLRDYFAAKVINALIQTPIDDWPNLASGTDSISKAAYEIADAMLKRREEA